MKSQVIVIHGGIVFSCLSCLDELVHVKRSMSVTYSIAALSSSVLAATPVCYEVHYGWTAVEPRPLLHSESYGR